MIAIVFAVLMRLFSLGEAGMLYNILCSDFPPNEVNRGKFFGCPEKDMRAAMESGS